MKEQSSSNACDFIPFDDNYFSIIGMDGDTPVALIVVKKRPLSAPMESIQEGYIDIIEIHPDYQRKGIDTVLMEKVIKWARDNRLSQLRAWSEEIRYEALMLGTRWDLLIPE